MSLIPRKALLAFIILSICLPSFTGAQNSNSLEQWTKISSQVYPMIARLDSLERPRNGMLLAAEGVTRPWQGIIGYYLAHLDDGKVTPLKLADVQSWGLGVEAVEQRAFANLKKAFSDNLVRPQPKSFPNGNTLEFAKNPLAPSYLLLPDFYTLMNSKMSGPFVLTVPNEGYLTVTQLGRGGSINLLGIDDLLASTRRNANDALYEPLLPEPPLLLVDSGFVAYDHGGRTLSNRVVRLN
jgi:hypothetical protein